VFDSPATCPFPVSIIATGLLALRGFSRVNLAVVLGHGSQDWGWAFSLNKNTQAITTFSPTGFEPSKSRNYNNHNLWHLCRDNAVRTGAGKSALICVAPMD
jgi:hypothetical protein